MITHNVDRWSEPQRAAIRARGQNVLVSAGAGSGKTSVLIERVIHCITGEHAVDLSRLLVVTFTEAAAAEMRSRLMSRLTALAEEYAGDIEAQRQISRQLMQIEQAQISTLHSFCMTVVRKNFLYLDLEPRFGMLATEDALALKTQLAEKLLEKHLEDDVDSRFRTMLKRFQAQNPTDIIHLVFRIDEFSRSQPRPREWLETMVRTYEDADVAGFSNTPWFSPFLTFVVRTVEDAIVLLTEAVLQARSADELSAYADNIVRMVEQLENARVQFLSSSSIDAGFAHLQAASSAGAVRVTAKDHPMKESVQKARNDAKKRIGKLVDILGRGVDGLVDDVLQLAPDIRVLVEFIVAFQTEYAALKRMRGVVDFSDLEHMALETLCDASSGEAVRLQEQFAEVFVDEYQDTSPIQDALVDALARPEGNVFVVGDVKQSIYRFRMAEPGLFVQKYSELGVVRPGQVIDLTANYRSRLEVVDAVNFFFAQLFSTEFGGVPYDERSRMQFGAAYYPKDGHSENLAGPAELHLIERSSDIRAAVPENATGGGLRDEDDDRSGPMEDEDDLSNLEKEASVIANRIQELMGNVDGHSRKSVWDARIGSYRPLQYRDIVILLRSVRGRMNTLLEVFRAVGIPAYGTTSSGFYGALEVQWVLAALSAIDNPRRDIDFVTLLRSPFAEFTDAELAEIRLVSGGTLYECMRRIGQSPRDLDAHVSESLLQKTKAFLKRLSSWRKKARRSSTEDVIRQILNDTDFVDYVMAMRGGDVRCANLDALLDRARDFDRSSNDGVFGFVRKSQAHIELEIDHGEARTLGENEDVVRLMTIHQSKGLEYPVVIVADLGKQFFRSAEERSFLLHRKLGFGPQFHHFETHRRWKTLPAFAIEEAEMLETLAEEARVLYVALTRAKERLILVGSASNIPALVTRQSASIQRDMEVLPLGTLMRGRSYLDWIVSAVMRHATGSQLWTLVDRNDGRDRRADVMMDHPARFDIQLWNLPGENNIPDLLQRGSPKHTVHWNVDNLDEVVEQMKSMTEDYNWDAEHPVGASADDPHTLENVPAKVSATELRRLWAARKGTQHSTFRSRASAEHLLDDPDFVNHDLTSGKDSGTAFHTLMQHIEFDMDPTPAAVQGVIDTLTRTGVLTDDQSQGIDLDAVVGFLRSKLADKLRQAQFVLREQSFFHRIEIGTKGTTTNQDGFVIVQGVIDCLARMNDDQWLIIDYKTDKISAEDTPMKAEEYSAQVATYLNVIRSTYPNDRVDAYIYFVKPQISLAMKPVDLGSVFE